MDRVKDHVFAVPAPWVASNNITTAADYDLIDIAAHPDLSVAISNWHRIVVGLVAHQCLRVHLTVGLITGVKRCCWQIHHRLKITRQALSDAIAVSAQNIHLTFAALLCQPEVQGFPRRKPGDGHHEVASSKPDQALNGALVVAFAGPTITVINEVMRQEPAEQLGPLTRATRQNLCHQAPIIIVKNRLRHAPKERKSMDVAINPSLGNGSGISAHKTSIAVGQIQREEMRLLFNATNHHHGFAEIRLSVAGGMCQRHKHLAAAPTVFTDVVLDRRVAAMESMLIPQPLKNALGGMSLLAVPAEILLQPLVNKAGKAIQFGTLDRRCSLVSWRHRKAHHLLHACT